MLQSQCWKRTTALGSRVRMEELVSTQQGHITVTVPIAGLEGIANKVDLFKNK